LLADPTLAAAGSRAFAAVPPLVFSIPSGPWIRLYGFNGQIVLNAQLQAILSLLEYAQRSEDPDAAALAQRLDTTAQALFSRFDTGDWSRYQLGGPPADLNYHVLNRDLAGALCQRTRDNVVCGAWRRFTRELDARCPRTGSSGSTARSGAGARARRPRRLPAPGRAARAA